MGLGGLIYINPYIKVFKAPPHSKIFWGTYTDIQKTSGWLFLFYVNTGVFLANALGEVRMKITKLTRHKDAKLYQQILVEYEPGDPAGQFQQRVNLDQIKRDCETYLIYQGFRLPKNWQNAAALNAEALNKHHDYGVQFAFQILFELAMLQRAKKSGDIESAIYYAMNIGSLVEQLGAEQSYKYHRQQTSKATARTKADRRDDCIELLKREALKVFGDIRFLELSDRQKFKKHLLHGRFKKEADVPPQYKLLHRALHSKKNDGFNTLLCESGLKK